MGIEAAICKIRRDFDKEGHVLNRAKLTLTSENAKTVGQILLAVAAVAAVAYTANKRGFSQGYGNGLNDGFDTGLWVGELRGYNQGYNNAWGRTV